MGRKYSQDTNKWHLRFSITAKCNFRCRYCLPEDENITIEDPNFSEMVETLQAAYDNGIRRVHWTGGEPTVREDFIDLVRSAGEIGFTQQVVTTNGSRLWTMIDELVMNGLTRVIVSMNSLNPERNFYITRARHFEDTLKSLKTSVKQLDTITKISVVTMKSTLKELDGYISLAQSLNEQYQGEVAIKFNQFFSTNPAQESKEGHKFWSEEVVTEEEIVDTLNNIGDLKPINKGNVRGDNPNYQYYLVGDTGVKVAVFTLSSWGSPCDGCWKLRVSPQGIVTICTNQKDYNNLWGKTLAEKKEALSEALSMSKPQNAQTQVSCTQPDALKAISTEYGCEDAS